ncbi:MAG: YceI family protein [Hyphomonadaceae bacterium]
MRAFLFAIALLAAPAAFAQETYRIDPAHTQVAFSIDRFGFNHVLGRFEQVEGALTLDVAAPANSSVHAVIQTASVSAGDDTRNEHLRGERWLNVAQYPTMEFRSTAVRVIDETHAEVTGDLTLLGQTHPVTLQVTLNRMGELPNNRRQGAGFSATGVISRTQFGLAAAPQLIGDEVRITIEALAEQEAPPAE